MTATEAKAELARRELLRRAARKSPAEWGRIATAQDCFPFPEAYVPSGFHQQISQAVIDVISGDLDAILLQVPVQHGKTTTGSVLATTWFLGNHPEKFVVAVSYNSEFAADKIGKPSRDILERHGERIFGVTVNSSSSAKHRWDTNHGGGLVTLGIEKGVAGRRADLLIIDDPYPGLQEASSKAFRDLAWGRYQYELATRLAPGAGQIHIMSRWNDDDHIARLSKLCTDIGLRWRMIDFPALSICSICDSAGIESINDCGHSVRDSLGRLCGEPLWAEKRSREFLLQQRAIVGSKTFGSLFQGRPQPDDGSLFKPGWMLNRYDNEPPAKRGCMFVDGAWKEGIANDRSAIAVWSTDSINYHLRHAWGARVEYPDLKQKVIDTYAAWKPKIPNLTLCVEDAASGMALVQELRRSTSIPVIGVPAKGSKEARAEAITPLFESGKAFLPRGAEWLDVWIDEHLRFPAGKHDDFVDTTSGALARLQQNSFMYVGPVDGLDVEADEPSRYHIEDIEV